MPSVKREYTKQEVINGIIYDMSPSADYRHGIVNGNIHAKVKNALNNSLCLVFIENLDYKYAKNNDYLIPDVMIVCDRKNLKGGSYSGVPKFIVETLSPATAIRDRTIKKDIYEACGVEEYWIISPKEKAVEIYYLCDGKYVLVNNYILDDDAESEYYNAEQEITLKTFPVTMKLEEIFEGID